INIESVRITARRQHPYEVKDKIEEAPPIPPAVPVKAGETKPVLNAPPITVKAPEKTEAKPETKPELKPEVKPDVKVEQKPETKPPAKDEAKSQASPEDQKK